MSIEENLRLAKESVKAYNDHDLDRGVTFWADEEQGLAQREFQKHLSQKLPDFRSIPARL